MNVLFDAQIFQQQRYGGISRYFCEVAQRIARFDGVHGRILAPRHDNAYLRDLPRGVLIGWPSSDRLKRLRGGARIERAAEQATRKAVDLFYRPDVLHETYYWQPKAPGRDRPAHVLTIYDMIHERFASMFPADDPSAQAKRIAAANADQIICISESTRRDVIEILGTPEDKIKVTYLAANLRPPSGERATVTTTTTTAAATADGAPYVLYVGERRGYKNFNRLVSAMQSSPVLRTLRLVCFGGGALTAADWQAIDDTGFQRSQIGHRHGGDEELARTYQGALCFVYPSLFEGFGIPPLEAMACDCPIACSNASSIPEVVGEAGAYFDPNDDASMAAAIESIVSSESRRRELIALGRKRARVFSWDRCAAETLSVYRAALAR